jgi:hypothetical protein
MRPAISSAVVVLVLSGLFAAAEEPKQITIRVFDTASVSDELLANAQELAAQLYERVGIEIHWIRGDRDALASAEREPAVRTAPGCPSVDRIDVKLQPTVRGLTRTTILASAFPYRNSGIRVRVPMAHLVAHARATGVPIDVILGFVLVHEVGHILIGSDWHSSTGIMRPKLEWTDMILPASEVPMFDATDAVYIRRNLEKSRIGCEPMLATR